MPDQSLPPYREGDVVVGVFSCLLPSKRRPIRVAVSARFNEHGCGGFIGEHLDNDESEGHGAWGWDSEIIEVEPSLEAIADGLALWDEHKPQSAEDWVAVAKRFAADPNFDWHRSSPLFGAAYLLARELAERDECE